MNIVLARIHVTVKYTKKENYRRYLNLLDTTISIGKAGKVFSLLAPAVSVFFFSLSYAYTLRCVIEGDFWILPCTVQLCETKIVHMS